MCYNLLISICYIRMIPKSQYVISRGLPNLSHLFWPWLRIQWWRFCWLIFNKYTKKTMIQQQNGVVKRQQVTVWVMVLGRHLAVSSNPDAVIILPNPSCHLPLVAQIADSCPLTSSLINGGFAHKYKNTNTQSAYMLILWIQTRSLGACLTSSFTIFGRSGRVTNAMMH